MKVCVVANIEKDKNLAITKRLVALFEEKGVHAEVLENHRALTGIEVDTSLLDDADFVITVGGDGTLIQTARQIYAFRKPIVGVNRGTLGYLTEINVENLPEAVDRLVAEEFFYEDRMMIKGKVERQGQVIFESFALNDAVISRDGYSHMIPFAVYVDQQLLSNYSADGLIVSTPTGSTAYNLSAGGPLMVPSASMMVVTPVCAHVLNARSVVIAPDSEVQIEIGLKGNPSEQVCSLIFDGVSSISLQPQDRITITRMAEATKLIRLSETSFYKTLQQKMQPI